MEQWPGYPSANYWERMSAGVYQTVGGRFTIKRRRPGNWWLIENATQSERRFDSLREAQGEANRLSQKPREQSSS